MFWDRHMDWKSIQLKGEVHVRKKWSLVQNSINFNVNFTLNCSQLWTVSQSVDNIFEKKLFSPSTAFNEHDFFKI